MTANQFRRHFDVRNCPQSCGTCKYGADLCDDGTYECKHPAIEDDRLFTSEGQTCWAWEQGR